MHDSEHSYECMTFEYREAFPHLKTGAPLVSDDINHNKSFYDFAKKENRQVLRLAKRTGIIIK